MTVSRLEHLGVVIGDVETAKAFFNRSFRDIDGQRAAPRTRVAAAAARDEQRSGTCDGAVDAE